MTNQRAKELSLRRAAAAASVLICVWMGLVLLFSAQLVFLGQSTWSDAISAALPFWMPWGLVSPLVVWLAFRFPIEKGRIWRNLALHLAACLGVVMFCQAANGSNGPGPGPGRAGNAPGFRGPPPFMTPEPGGPRGPGFRGPPGMGGGPRSGQGPLGRPNPFRGTFDFMLYAGIVSVCHAVALFRTSKLRELRTAELESRLATARLQALRMQLNPHFLFNTLNAISTLVHTNPAAADEMIGDLSELLRFSLATEGEDVVSLRRELEFLQRYLAIEKVRFGARLRVEEAIAMETLDAAVPTLILQPLVENAVRHGVEKRRTPGRIKIRAVKEGDRLMLSVNDHVEPVESESGQAGNPVTSGGGTSFLKKPSRTAEGHGIGLTNTKERLRELYGPGHSLDIHQSDETGFTVEISIPFRPSPTLRGPLPSAHT